MTPPAPADDDRDAPAFLREIAWNADGLVPAVVQDARTSEVLMMAWMDRTALEKTLETGLTHFHSRSRRRGWLKGETSGHVQRVESIHVDCDADVVLVKAVQTGGACHTGHRSCFFRRVTPDGRLEAEGEPVFDPEAVYRAVAATPPNVGDDERNEVIEGDGVPLPEGASIH